ncbi:hypothetical protein B0I08_106305 [Glaciihabitans tibetensis]|uniref:Uncharacterized protein n=1 Tax=Glaciihabitans tibetensis TaxID=1266600 RepID=A0A2T0VC71_9MICO|nr:hypothetical protein [Glaciihabitans tibetensis]PRY67697.1 hypothetical protein B0I08_106305 [Glaciihabitans tibetensis]
MADDSKTIPLLLTAGPVGSGSLNLRFPREYTAEIKALLDDNGIEHSSAAEFSEGVELAIEAVRIGTGAAGIVGGLGFMYRTFVHRHDGKRVAISKDGDLDVSGFSQKRTEQIIENQVTAQAERDAEWFRSIGSESPDQ